MKTTRLLLLALGVLVVTVTSFGLLPDIAFKEKYKKLQAANAKPAELEKLVKTESGNASAWIARENEILVDRPDDPDAGPFLEALSATWKAAMKSAYPDKEKAFFAQLAGQKKKDRVDLRKRLDKILTDLDQNREKKENFVFTQVADELDVLTGGFEDVGDFYLASEASLAMAECFDEPLRGTDADPKKVIPWLEKALDYRAKIDLADTRSEAATKRKTALAKGEKGGEKPPEKGGEKGAGKGKEGPEQPATDNGAPVTVPLTFEVVSSIESFLRPCYTADENYLLWNSIALKAKGTSGGLATLPSGPQAVRVGGSDVRFDTDGDGKGDGPNDEKIPLTGGIAVTKITLGKGADARPWAFQAATGQQKDNYQGLQVNLQPDDKQMTIYALSAASVVGTLDGTPFRIIDDSMDGVYGSEPPNFGYVGLTKDIFQPELDCILIGNAKRARPWSEYQEINGHWYRLEGLSIGKELKASPVKVDTGTMKLDFKGGTPPTWVVMKGTGDLAKSYFDLVEGGSKGVSVPVGRYTLFYGEIRKGKKAQTQKCLILPPRSPDNYEVKKGETTLVTLGAPFNFDFKTHVEEGKLTVEGTSVCVIGAKGERYERAWQCVARPEAGWRKKGAKKAAKYEKMPAMLDSEGINKKGWAAAWFPLDLEMDVKGQGDVEVQLTEKKHDLFGKIESDWR